MKLTDDGERCYQHARRVIDTWLALEDELSQTEDEPSGCFVCGRLMPLVRSSCWLR
jgi:DNA-binding transcriptional LysR family regulator